MKDTTKARAYNADWKAIKKDFLQGMTYRALAKKYNVGLGTISDHAKKEGWLNLKERVTEQTEQKMVENLSDRNARISVKVADGVEIAVEKTIAGLKAVDKKDSVKIRAYMSVLKDAKEMGLFRTERDIAEQTARIKKLEKDASTEEQDNTIKVIMSDEVSQYAN